MSKPLPLASLLLISTALVAPATAMAQSEPGTETPAPPAADPAAETPADPADVAAAIDARCDYGVNAVGYGLLRVANSPANGNDINPGGVRGGDGILGAAQTRDQDWNLLFDNDIDHFLDRFRVSRGDVAFRAHRREKDIDAKGLIRDGANGVDFSFDLITRHVRTGADDSEAACFRNRAGKCAARNKPHAGLKDRIFNSKPFANFRLQSWHIILSA